ncbi:hypothetical protein GCM10023190_09650 [Enteractinococcus fodinae]|uniref:Uncharacterized protein n=1 Tax=Enteractinococcus fodinae TaxID=684663 RepID=A0ABU2AYZ0_9MICC|nr:hypothetical protein [Enteractinococcus fodinae]MDR7346560.1 hypothetical protein [Enteractinococcus fodinae]
MRNFLAVVLAILAGLTTVVGLVSWRLSDLVHEPEPVQEILGSGEAAEDFKSAVPDALGNMTVGATGVAAVDETINRAVSEASGQVVAADGFDQAWQESLEATRLGWADDINTLRSQLNAGESIPENSTAAQLDLRLEPIVGLVVSMIEDALSTIPGVDASLDMESDIDATVPTSIPPVSVLTAEQVVVAEEVMTLWPAMLALAVLLFVMALVVASPGSRWIVWLLTGLLVALGGVLVKVGYTLMQNQLLDSTDDASQLALLRPLLRAVQDWADPQLIVLIAVGVGLTLLGILGGFISSHRRR